MRLSSPYDRLLIPIYLPSALMSISNQAMILLLPLYALQLSGSAAFAALVMGMRGLGVLLFDVPAGMLVGRFGDKPVLFGGLVTLAIAMIALAVASDQWVFALLTVPFGAATAAWSLGWLSYITDSCGPNERGRAISVMAGVHRVGAFAGPLAGAVVAEYFSYPVAFVAGAIIAAIAAALALAFTENIPPVVRAETNQLKTIGRIVASNRRIFATAGSVALALQLMRAIRQLLIPLFGVFVGLDPVAIGLIYSLSAVVDMSLFYPVGIIMDRSGRKWTGVPSVLVFVLGLIVLPLSQGFYTLLGAGLLLGLANGLSTGIVMVIGMDLRAAGRARTVSGCLAAHRRSWRTRRAAPGRRTRGCRQSCRGELCRGRHRAGVGVRVSLLGAGDTAQCAETIRIDAAALAGAPLHRSERA